MPQTFSFYGLDQTRSRTAVRLLLFSPALEASLGSAWCAEFAGTLIDCFLKGDKDGFENACQEAGPRVKKEFPDRYPELSMENPPWSMFSLDMLFGMIPWSTPAFEELLHLLFKRGREGTLSSLPIAFVLSGGPGDSKGTAFRICAPSQMSRASSEYWLMRTFFRQPPHTHATLARDEKSRSYSLHRYTDGGGVDRDVYFDTTDSFGREADDFTALLDGAL